MIDHHRLWETLKTLFEYNEDTTSVDLMNKLEEIEHKAEAEVNWEGSVGVSGLTIVKENGKGKVTGTNDEEEPKEFTLPNFFCPSCAFKTASKQGLSIHMGSMHKGSNLKKGVLPERSTQLGIVSNTPKHPPKDK